MQVREPSKSAVAVRSDAGETGEVKFRELVRQVLADRWYLHEQTGSHAQYKHPMKKGRVTIAGKPGKDVPEGTRKSILKQAGVEK